MVSYNIEATHFVLGEKNKEFLLRNNVPEDNIILIDKKAVISEENVSNFNKTFLVKCATEVFPDNELFFIDYDCNLQKDFDKDDIYNRFRKNKISIQGPTICYRRRRLCGPGNKGVRSGFCTCFFYCSDHDIIREWYKIHSTTLYHRTNDESPMLWVLTEMFNIISPKDLYKFDTDVIRTGRRIKCEHYDAENYKDAYFSHR